MGRLRESRFIQILKQASNKRHIRHTGVALMVIVCLVFTLCIDLPSTYSWLVDSLRDDTPKMLSYIRYLKGGGTA